MLWEYFEIVTDNDGKVLLENGVNTGLFISSFMFPFVSNFMGREGWEMITAIANPERHRVSYVFKRPLNGIGLA